VRPGARLRVVRGSPSSQEALAVLLAIDLVRSADAADAADALRPMPAWRAAARLEATGATRVVAAADLEAARQRPLT
jgi:hypothetical protein